MMGDTPFPHYLLLPTTEMCSSTNQIVINRPKKMVTATAKNMVKTKKKQEMMQKVTQAWFTRTMNTSATSVSRKSSNMKSRNLSGKI